MSDADLELYVEITKPDGRFFRWDGDGYAEDIPAGLVCSSKRMEGFSTFSCTLPRRIDEDYPDVELRDELAVYSASGDTAWEGRVSAAPRSMDDGHSIDIQAVGWMASARDRPFQENIVDRDLSRWGASSTQRKVALNATFRVTDPSAADKVRTSFSGPWTTTPGRPTSEAWYDSGGIPIGSLQYFWTRGANVSSGADANFTWLAGLADDRVATTLDQTGDLQAAGPGSGTVTALGTRAYGLLAFSYGNVAAGDQREYAIDWGPVAVYGTHGLTLRDVAAGEPQGVYASDVMAHVIATYCPKLRWAGNDSTYPIPHLVFRELTDPYDALLACNAFHLFDLACWEDRTVHWAPVDLSDWDWEIRLDDPGVKIQLEGDSDDDLANGIVIEYTDLLTGEAKVLWPDDHDELTDSDELNPANRHGDEKWVSRKLTNPALEGSALQMGRALLAEHNQPKSPGQYTVEGYVRDRQGTWQPGWKVRSGERIVIADHPNRRPRLITETQWSAESHSLTLATDSAIQRIDAYLDRTAMALAANGLS